MEFVLKNSVSVTVGQFVYTLAASQSTSKVAGFRDYPVHREIFYDFNGFGNLLEPDVFSCVWNIDPQK